MTCSLHITLKINITQVLQQQKTLHLLLHSPLTSKMLSFKQTKHKYTITDFHFRFLPVWHVSERYQKLCIESKNVLVVGDLPFIRTLWFTATIFIQSLRGKQLNSS